MSRNTKVFQNCPTPSKCKVHMLRCFVVRLPGSSSESTRPLCPWDAPGKDNWSGFPCPPPGDLPDPGIKPASPTSPALVGGFFTTVPSRKPLVQFSSVAQSCPTLCDPMNCSTPGLPVHHQLPEFTQTHVHRLGDAIQPSHPLSSPSPPAPNPSQHQSLFQWVNSSDEVAKVLEFQL